MKRSNSFQLSSSTGKLHRIGKALDDAMRRRSRGKDRGLFPRGDGGRSGSRQERAEPAEVSVNKFEGSSLAQDGPLHGRLLAFLTAPFLPVFLYALYALFNSFWLSAYIGFLLLYFLVLAAWAISEVAIRPPWYHNTKPEDGLTMLDLPTYWQGKCRDPLTDVGLDFEDVAFRTDSGATLRGWYVPGPRDSPTDLSASYSPSVGIVCVHGGGRDRRAWLRHLPLFHEAGWSVLLFDFGEHGTSDGNHRGFTFGVREQHDVMAAVRFMRTEKLHQKVAAVGTSVGGASVIMAASRDRSIDCVVAENPVASADIFLTGHVKHVLGAYAPYWLTEYALRPFYWLISNIFLFRIGALLSRENALNAAPKVSPTPLFLMHGTMDDLVPPEHTSMLAAAAEDPCEIWMAPDAWHCALYDKHPEEYAERVLGFLRRHLESRE